MAKGVVQHRQILGMSKLAVTFLAGKGTIHRKGAGLNGHLARPRRALYLHSDLPSFLKMK